MAHTDIVPESWIRRLPASMRPYALLARLDRPIGTWLLFLPGAWGILLPGGVAPIERLRLLVLFAAGSLVMRSAGCVVNDMWDRDLDRQVERTRGRPLAAGTLGMRQAAAFLLLLLGVGLLVLLMLPLLCWELGVLSLVLVGLYPLAKRVTWWPQLVMGFTFGFGAPMGYAAAAGRIDVAWALVYAGAILWDLGFDTVYGFQDMADDAVVGIRSTSRLMAAVPKRFVGTCYALASAALVAAGGSAGLDAWGLLAAVPAAALLGWQVRALDPSHPRGCLELFRLNRETGLAITFAIAVGRFC